MCTASGYRRFQKRRRQARTKVLPAVLSRAPGDGATSGGSFTRGLRWGRSAASVLVGEGERDKAALVPGLQAHQHGLAAILARRIERILHVRRGGDGLA